MIMIFNHLNLICITPSDECLRTSTVALSGIQLQHPSRVINSSMLSHFIIFKCNKMVSGINCFKTCMRRNQDGRIPK